MRSPKDVARYTCDVGNSKVNQSFLKTFILAILAGLFIGIGYYAYLTINSLVLIYDQGILAVVASAFVFTVGIIMIIIGGGDLFTGNCLITFGALDKQYSFKKVAINLVIVFVGNFVGALLLVGLVYLVKPNANMTNLITSISQTKVSYSFITALARGILCNILVAMGVYLSYAAETIAGKIVAVFFPIFTFVIIGLEHGVANMFILSFSLFQGDISIIEMLINNLLPVTIGNFIGGGLILPFAYYFAYLNNYKEKNS